MLVTVDVCSENGAAANTMSALDVMSLSNTEDTIRVSNEPSNEFKSPNCRAVGLIPSAITIAALIEPSRIPSRISVTPLGSPAGKSTPQVSHSRAARRDPASNGRQPICSDPRAFAPK